MVEALTGIPMKFDISEINRIGDHICYYSDLRKIKRDYPAWDITIDLPRIFQELIDSWQKRLGL
jgi:CDP-paratose 2-epimerase